VDPPIALVAGGASILRAVKSQVEIQPQLWVGDAAAAVRAYERALGAVIEHRVADQQGWRVGRFHDPFGREWEVGRPLGPWPPRG
jgi:uncharacterized glyoxalase superfamily protein PhnB